MSFEDFGDRRVIPYLGKDENEKLTFKGSVVGDGVKIVTDPSALSANDPNGSVAVALAADTSNAITYPAQVSDENVTINVTGKNILVGAPTYSSTAIGAAITAADLPEAQIDSDGIATSMVTIIPVVADVSNNDYVTAGITLNTDNVIVASGAAKEYAVSLMVPPDSIKPAKIEEVDAGHVKVPSIYIFAFENLTGTVNGLSNESLVSGWNVGVFTVDTATMQDISGVEIVTGIDINDYIVFDPEKVADIEIEGTSGVDLFEDIIVGAAGEPAGVYVKLSGEWKRLALDE